MSITICNVYCNDFLVSCIIRSLFRGGIYICKYKISYFKVTVITLLCFKSIFGGSKMYRYYTETFVFFLELCCGPWASFTRK